MPSAGAVPSGSSSIARLASSSPRSAARAEAPRGRFARSPALRSCPRTERTTTAATVACSAPAKSDKEHAGPAEPCAREHDELRVAQPHPSAPPERLVDDDEGEPDAEEIRRPRRTACRDQPSPRSAGVARPKIVPPIVIASGKYMCSASMNAAARSAIASPKSARKTQAACANVASPGSDRRTISKTASASRPPSSSTTT